MYLLTGFFFKPGPMETNPPVEWHLPGDTIVQSTLYSDLFINTQECSTLTAASVCSCRCVNNKRQLTGHTKGYVYIYFMQFQTNAFYKYIIIAISCLHLIKQQKSAMLKAQLYLTVLLPDLSGTKYFHRHLGFFFPLPNHLSKFLDGSFAQK